MDKDSEEQQTENPALEDWVQANANTQYNQEMHLCCFPVIFPGVVKLNDNR